MAAVVPNVKGDTKLPYSAGKSRQSFFEHPGEPRLRYVKFRNVTANKTFTLPANCFIKGDAIIGNESGNTQAVITIGTSAAGTQISAGATVATLTTQEVTLTKTAITRADRTIYVESAAWQTGVSIAIPVYEVPTIPTTLALS